MAAYISVPRDLTRVKSKVFMNLTKRQVICFGTAVLIGVPSFFLLREYGGNTLATLGMMILMLPLFFLAMYEKKWPAPGEVSEPLYPGTFYPSQGAALPHRKLLRPAPAAGGAGTGGRCDCFPFLERKRLIL